MATITDDDFTFIKQWVRSRAGQSPDHKAIFKAWSLDKSTWQSLFQAIEDYEVNAFNSIPTTSIKTAIENVTGTATSNQAQRAFETWVAWRFKEL